MSNIKIRIGSSGDALASAQAEYTKTELAHIGVESEIVIVPSPEAALLHGEVDVVVRSMPEVSSSQPEGLVITAVSKRENAADLMLIHRESFVPREIFKVKKDGSVGISGEHRKIQLRDIRPDLQLKEVSGDISAQLETLRSGELDAIILTAADVKLLAADLTDLETIELNPKEFIPLPGQGVIAWQCNRDDLATRRIFRRLQRSEVSSCTNIERRVLQLMTENNRDVFGAYCERDISGNLHCFAVCGIDGEVLRAHLSSSTSIGVAEKLVAKLKQ